MIHYVILALCFFLVLLFSSRLSSLLLSAAGSQIKGVKSVCPHATHISFPPVFSAGPVNVEPYL